MEINKQFDSDTDPHVEEEWLDYKDKFVNLDKLMMFIRNTCYTAH